MLNERNPTLARANASAPTAAGGKPVSTNAGLGFGKLRSPRQKQSKPDPTASFKLGAAQVMTAKGGKQQTYSKLVGRHGA